MAMKVSASQWICSNFTFCYVVVQYFVLCCDSAVFMDQLGLGAKTSWLGKIVLWLKILATNMAENAVTAKNCPTFWFRISRRATVTNFGTQSKTVGTGLAAFTPLTPLFLFMKVNM